MAYIERSLEAVVRKAAQEFPAIVLTGPRQSGKTTLLRYLFGRSRDYVSLEPPDVQLGATRDPQSFLALHPPPVVLDDIQYVPDLLPYIKEVIDSQRNESVLYVMAGSQDLLLMERFTETLGDRAAMLKVSPLSWREADGQPGRPLPWDLNGASSHPPMAGVAARNLWQQLIVGGYPEFFSGLGRDPTMWHSSHVQTYLERDVRGLRQIENLTVFQTFLRTLAARSGQLLNLTDISRELGIAVNTAKSWLALLEATYQVMIVRPYFADIGKRLVKTPKVYFTDTGTLSYLTGLRDAEHAASSPLSGPIFETAVLSEIVRTSLGRGENPRVHFWRTSAGAEVDFLIEQDTKLVPIEVTPSPMPHPEMAGAIDTFRRDFPERTLPGYVVHTGDVTLPLKPGITAISFASL